MNPRNKPKQITEQDVRLLEAKETQEVEQALINLDILAASSELSINTEKKKLYVDRLISAQLQELTESVQKESIIQKSDQIKEFYNKILEIREEKESFDLDNIDGSQEYLNLVARENILVLKVTRLNQELEELTQISNIFSETFEYEDEKRTSKNIESIINNPEKKRTTVKSYNASTSISIFSDRFNEIRRI